MHGLTTAASSWAAAAMGILAGAGAYLTAALGTVLVVLLLEANRLPVSQRLGRNKHLAPGEERFGTPAWPTVRPPATDEEDAPDPGAT